MLHVCLAGQAITANRALLDAHKAHHDGSLVADPSRLHASSVLDFSYVLALDASGIRAGLQTLLLSLRQRRRDLPIVRRRDR